MNHDYFSSKTNLPPRDAATDPSEAVYSDSTGAAAANISIWAAYDDNHESITNGPPKGKVWVEFEALTQVAYIRFKRTATAAATTTANGAVIPVGTPKKFYLDPTIDVVADVIAAGAGTLKWRVCGRPSDRAYQ